MNLPEVISIKIKLCLQIDSNNCLQIGHVLLSLSVFLASSDLYFHSLQMVYFLLSLNFLYILTVKEANLLINISLYAFIPIKLGDISYWAVVLCLSF